jgi:hypothetical protein
MDRISKLERAKKRLSPAEIRTLFADLAEPFVPGLNAVREGMAGNYGTAAVSGLLDVGGPIGKGVGLAAAPLMGAIRVFHGSPHKFDKFDMSKIGTGEGMQVYGQGLYFAENPKVAQGYAEKLDPMRNIAKSDVGASGIAARALEDAGGNKSVAIRNLENRKKMEHVQNNKDFQKKIDDGIEFLKRDLPQKQLYEVNLRWPGSREAVDPLGPQHFLDWDKPYAEQPKFVRDALEQEAKKYRATEGAQGAYVTSGTGNQIFNELKRTYGSPDAARIKASELGLPGIRYFDAMSRGTGGTSNYVIFDDQLAEILRRNPGLLE